MTNTAVQTNEDFQQRMFKKIREQMGDLMTDAELKKIVNAAMEKAFFEDTVVKDEYGRERSRTESALVSAIREEMRPAVIQAAQMWMAQNPDVLTKAINECIGAGFFGIIKNHIDSKINWPLQEFASALRNKGIL